MRTPVLRGPFRSEDRSADPLSPHRNRPGPPSSKPDAGGSSPPRRANPPNVYNRLANVVWRGRRAVGRPLLHARLGAQGPHAGSEADMARSFLLSAPFCSRAARSPSRIRSPALPDGVVAKDSTGIEGYDGRLLVWRRRSERDRELCGHYCAGHDHRWGHRDRRCVQLEVTPCGEARTP